MKSLCRLIVEECKAADIPVMPIEEIVDELFAELETRCMDDVEPERLVALRVAGLFLRGLIEDSAIAFAEVMNIAQTRKVDSAEIPKVLFDIIGEEGVASLVELINNILCQEGQ